MPPGQQALAYSIVIENRTGGVIRAVDPPAQFLLARPGVNLGTVVRPTTAVDTAGFHASLWGQAQTVVASAVNAVHLKVYDDPHAGRAGVVTLLPAELYRRGLDGSQSEVRDDVLYTDIPGGHSIFGGAYPLIVGNPVSFYRGRQHVYFDAENTALQVGDIIIIEVRMPARWPQGMLLENRPGGSVTLVLDDGERVALGTMEKAASGTGRFAGGIFSAPGGIRATHTGVLDLDFSPVDEMGGLQLIPHAHSLSPELVYTREAPPYGILLGVGGRDLRGQPPLFSSYVYPLSGLEAPAVLPQLVVSIQLGGSPTWLPLPVIFGREDLSGLSGLRLEWLTQAAAPQTAVEQGQQTEEQPAAPIEVHPVSPPTLRAK